MRYGDVAASAAPAAPGRHQSAPRNRPAVYRPLPPPAALIADIPLGADEARVDLYRSEARAILDGTDDRLLVVAGPCSVHDPAAAVDYAHRLAALAAAFSADLLVVMRVYMEKPRTSTGWRGLISEPALDGTLDMARGLSTARALLADIAAEGVPAACEWLDPLVAPYLQDAITWAAIGARTTESQPHRQLVSGLPMPVGFKNATDGSVQPAVDACRAAAIGHEYLTADPGGCGHAIAASAGNPDCHVVLRGGRAGANYAARDVAGALDLIAAAGLPRRVVIDASHGNSGKDYRRQPAVARDVAAQVAGGQDGITGVMIESFLQAGRQDPGPGGLAYGKSITDACIDIDTTADVFDTLAAAVRGRRETRRT
jgi:3-deoxy-7-phosphoheptulonate synthase